MNDYTREYETIPNYRAPVEVEPVAGEAELIVLQMVVWGMVAVVVAMAAILWTVAAWRW